MVFFNTEPPTKKAKMNYNPNCSAVRGTGQYHDWPINTERKKKYSSDTMIFSSVSTASTMASPRSISTVSSHAPHDWTVCVVEHTSAHT